MPLTMDINSAAKKLNLSETTIKHYKFNYAEADNYAKGNPEVIGLDVTIDFREILSSDGSPAANKQLVQDLRDWAEYDPRETGSFEEYYREVSLNNYFGENEVREIALSDAYVNKATESVDLLSGKHTLTLELLQKEDMLGYGD